MKAFSASERESLHHSPSHPRFKNIPGVSDEGTRSEESRGADCVCDGGVCAFLTHFQTQSVKEMNSRAG